MTRRIPATTVPQGERIELDEGTEVEVFQQLGNSVTVLTQAGTLLRIDGADGDALGLEKVTVPNADGSEPYSPEHVIGALKGVYDPEIPVNIVDLGLVYRCDEVPLEDGRRRIEIDMTMTAPGCGMGDVLTADAERAVGSVPGVDEVDVNLVWDPPWDMSRMSEETRLELGLL
ncbi:MAG: putative Fe-S cluster assembly protein SufT [Microthrixaceae bacterium]|nr:putative Fe-S cluster assembly protein SufT [Microthrixaceae bacterium]